MTLTGIPGKKQGRTQPLCIGESQKSHASQKCREDLSLTSVSKLGGCLPHTLKIEASVLFYCSMLTKGIWLKAIGLNNTQTPHTPVPLMNIQQMAKTNVGRKRFILAYSCSLSCIQGRNLEVETAADAIEKHCLMTCALCFTHLVSYAMSNYLFRDGTSTHVGWVYSHQSCYENALQVCLQ